jgi:uncharacterized protein
MFGFDHVWELYKPASVRRYRPYTMPILIGDALVGRVELSLDRTRVCLNTNGVWFEKGCATPSVEASTAAGLDRLATFLGASRVELGRKIPTRTRRALKPHF